ncbi:ComEC/Rec2 family competence protein [Nocardia arizonensis]|uniref:ComEC/Rec2 family competence protein n=1 Tax=Nocardia arizonensis TaxID=1141647 RepID=UPI0023B8667D|nr:ComEC/Rec2 family competence protein [Nocardia arizonensis]
MTLGWRVGVGLAVMSVVGAVGVCAVYRRRRARIAVGERGRERGSGPGGGRRGVAGVVSAALLIGAGFAVAAVWREYGVAEHPLRDAVGGSVSVVSTVRDDPKVVRGKGFGGQRLWVVHAELERFRGRDGAVVAGGTVVILGEGQGWGRVVPGQAVEFRARVEPARFRDLTVAALRATEPPRPVGGVSWWQRGAAAVRAALAAAAGRALSERAAGLLPALVVGDTSRLSDSVRTDFETAGLQHLCVVSGANFTILLTVVLFVVRTVALGPRSAAALAGVALLLFVVVARPDPSVLRAAAMGAVTVLSLVTGQRKQALPALCAAVIGLLAIWPELAVSAGFALSVVATAGLILLAPSWADWLRARGWWRLPAEIVAVSAGAFVVTTPILVALTGRLSLIAVLANILAAPVVAPITVIGALGAATAWICPLLATLILRASAPPMWWLLEVAERTAALPGSSIAVPGGMAGGLVAAAVVVAIVWGLRIAAVRRLAVAAIVGCALVLVPVRIWHPGWPPRDWVFVACDVGQGDALALAVGDGSAIVIDTGPDPRLVHSCLNRLRVQHIPLLVLTHPHADHIAGLAGALDGRSVAAIAVAPHELDLPASASGRRADGSGAVAVADAALAASIPVLELSAGQVLGFGSIALEVLAPTPASRPDAEANANDRSLVIAAETPAGRILLTGDVEAATQRRLLATGRERLHADVLKVPHHGSHTTAKEFLRAVRPRVAVTSVGAQNTFGHPDPEILAELDSLGVTVLRTDRDGDILVLGSAPGLRIATTRRRIKTGGRVRGARAASDPSRRWGRGEPPDDHTATTRRARTP